MINIYDWNISKMCGFWVLSSSKKNNCILSSDTVASGAFVSACVSVGDGAWVQWIRSLEKINGF